MFCNMLVADKEVFLELLAEWPEMGTTVRCISNLRIQLCMKVKAAIRASQQMARRTESVEQSFISQRAAEEEAFKKFDARTYEDGEQLIVEGEEVDSHSSVFVIVRGKVSVVVQGKQVAVRTKGACLGEGALLGTRRNATVVAMGQVLG